MDNRLRRDSPTKRWFLEAGQSVIATAIAGSFVGAVVAYLAATSFQGQAKPALGSIYPEKAVFYLAGPGAKYETSAGLSIEVDSVRKVIAPNYPVVGRLTISANDKRLFIGRDMAWDAVLVSYDPLTNCRFAVQVKRFETPDGPRAGVILQITTEHGSLPCPYESKPVDY
jgi:hypothetical protein